MPKKEPGNLVGAWAFLIGVILALIFGIFPPTTWVIWTLVIIGLIVGLLNITAAETQSFLLAGTVLVVVSALGKTAGLVATGIIGIGYLLGVLNNLLTLFIPATVIVALKSVFTLARK